MTPAEEATARLYGDIHRYASPTFALDYFLPGFRKHLAALGLDADRALQGIRVLDAGCGGYAGGIAIMKALGARYAVGVDLSWENLEHARERLRGTPGVRLERGNLLDLPLRDNRFDFVYCNGVLMSTEDPQRGFRELVRVLRPGGRIYIGVYGRGGLFNEVAVPLMKAAGRIVPRPITTRALRYVPRLLEPSTSLLDFMYVPIEHHYHASDVAGWFETVKIQPTFLRHYYELDTALSRALYGEGTMLFFSGIKP